MEKKNKGLNRRKFIFTAAAGATAGLLGNAVLKLDAQTAAAAEKPATMGKTPHHPRAGQDRHPRSRSSPWG